MAPHRNARESCGIHQLSALLDRAADIGVADPNNLPGPDRRTPPPECSARRAAKASAGAAAAKWQERRQAPQACSGTSASTRGPALRCKTSGVRSQRCTRHQDSVGRLTARARREAKTRPVPISLHPRGRGEHARSSIVTSAGGGSSPRGRGTRQAGICDGILSVSSRLSSQLVQRCGRLETVRARVRRAGRSRRLSARSIPRDIVQAGAAPDAATTAGRRRSCSKGRCSAETSPRSPRPI